MTTSQPNFAALKLLILDVDGVLTDGMLYYGPEGEALKVFNVKDGMGLQLLMRAGIEVAICSNGRCPRPIEMRAAHLGIDQVYVGSEKKQDIVLRWIKARGLTAAEVAYVGDDLNDIPAMQLCGFTACPSDAVDAVKAVVTQILPLGGGKGCVRYFADQILTAIQ